VSVAIRPSLPRRPSVHIHLIPDTTETIVNCYHPASFVRQVAAEEEPKEEIAVVVDDMPVDSFDLLPGMTSDVFSQ